MKAILAVLEHIRADLLDAIHAVEDGDVAGALAKLDAIGLRLRDAAKELKE